MWSAVRGIINPQFSRGKRELLFIPAIAALCEMGDFTRNILIRNYFAYSVDLVSRMTVTRI